MNINEANSSDIGNIPGKKIKAISPHYTRIITRDGSEKKPVRIYAYAINTDKLLPGQLYFVAEIQSSRVIIDGIDNIFINGEEVEICIINEKGKTIVWNPYLEEEEMSTDKNFSN